MKYNNRKLKLKKNLKYTIIFIMRSCNIRFNLPSNLVPLVGLYRLIPIGKAYIILRKPIF